MIMAEALFMAKLGAIEEMLLMDTTVEEVNSKASKDGTYRALKIIGKGAFGTVFLGEHKKEGIKVAIKICKTDVGFFQMVMQGVKSKDLFDQALQEARILSQLQHPSILTMLDVYDFTSARGGRGIAIVTEYCEKGNLQQCLEKYRPSRDARFLWCFQLAKALEYIHGKRITHRDIKPANILIDGEDNVKIADVGVAKAAWDFSTSLKGITDVSFDVYMNTKAGSPAYMAPEIFDSHYTEKSDIFSLGLVFVMIVESPAVLIPYAKYLGNRKVLGQLLHDHPAARGCHSCDLLDMEFNHASTPEVRLFGSMLKYNYRDRPTATEVADEIEHINRVAKITDLLILSLIQPKPKRKPKIKCAC